MKWTKGNEDEVENTYVAVATAVGLELPILTVPDILVHIALLLARLFLEFDIRERETRDTHLDDGFSRYSAVILAGNSGVAEHARMAGRCGWM